MSLRKHPAFDPPPTSDRVDAPRQSPMTNAQASALKALAEEACEPDAYDETLTAPEAAARIAALEAKLAKERNAGEERPG
jgi:Protein of unknown function (DUF3072)